MKKFILSLLILAVTAISADARTFVLATGVSNYGDEETNLEQSTKDVKRFRDVMLTQTKDITVLTSRNVTKSNVMEKLRAICNRAQKGDRIIFFFSGHGMPGAICAYDTPIAYDDIVSLLSESAASQKICFIDACHAGSMKSAYNDGTWMKSVPQEKGQAFFVSCRADELSAEFGLLGAGFFTQALIKGLQGKSDTDGNKEITVKELFKYVHGDVTKRSKGKQHPQLIAPKNMYDQVVAKWK